jgi:protein-S-isoprenylcysteine O-methyltransferase Ste14
LSLRRIDIPPVWLAAHLAGAWLLSRLSPALFGALGRVAGQVLVLAGVLLTIAAVAQMLMARTTFIPRRVPAALVTGGPFSLSRNPIYLADAMILAGAILWLDAALALPLLGSFVWVIQARFIRDEEAQLTAAFGPEFDLWAARTRRWIGRK